MDIPNGDVTHLPCPEGHSCGFKCHDGFRKHALAWDDPSCYNGTWILRTTKYDASITPQTVCVPNGRYWGVCLTLCMLGNLSLLFVVCYFFSKLTFSKISFGITNKVANSLDRDQARRFVGPGLDPYCLQRLSADDTKY